MDESEYNLQIEKIANLMMSDKISVDEQDPKKLEKYHNFAKTSFNLGDEAALQIVYEALLFLKLKESDSVDPLQEGDKFGAGFS